MIIYNSHLNKRKEVIDGIEKESDEIKRHIWKNKIKLHQEIYGCATKTTITVDKSTIATPIPVPSDAFDFTPRDLWPIIQEEYPHGIEMPATVPKKLWDAHWKRRNPELAEKEVPPAPPAFWKCYWGKFRGRALSDRKRKRADDEGECEGLPPVWPQQLSKRFWERYFEVFPDGHPAPEQGPYRPYVAGEQEPEKYKLISGSLHVNVSGNPRCPIWRPSSGVDAWDKDGSWMGAG